MSYLTSLNPQIFKNIAYVGSFKHFSVKFFVICILSQRTQQQTFQFVSLASTTFQCPREKAWVPYIQNNYIDVTFECVAYCWITSNMILKDKADVPTNKRFGQPFKCFQIHIWCTIYYFDNPIGPFVLMASMVREAILKKNVFFKALPEKGGETPARICWPFFPPCFPLYFDINIMLFDTF